MDTERPQQCTKPKLVDHGSLQELTAKFGGKFSDVALGGVNTTPAGNSNP